MIYVGWYGVYLITVNTRQYLFFIELIFELGPYLDPKKFKLKPLTCRKSKLQSKCVDRVGGKRERVVRQVCRIKRNMMRHNTRELPTETDSSYRIRNGILYWEDSLAKDMKSYERSLLEEKLRDAVLRLDKAQNQIVSLDKQIRELDLLYKRAQTTKKHSFRYNLRLRLSVITGRTYKFFHTPTFNRDLWASLT